MSRTPETITNTTAQFFRTALIIIGAIFALGALGAIQSGGNPVFAILLSVGAFIIAAKIKVTWHKKAEAGVYK